MDRDETGVTEREHPLADRAETTQRGCCRTTPHRDSRSESCTVSVQACRNVNHGTAAERRSRYGQHLSVDEIHDIISPSADTITLVHAWLLDHNIHDAAFSPSKDWVSVVIPIGKAEKLLQTSYKEFKHDEDGSTLSRAPEWSLPLHLHDHIDVVQPTTSFFRAARDPNLPRQQDASVAVERREITAEAKRNVEVS